MAKSYPIEKKIEVMEVYFDEDAPFNVEEIAEEVGVSTGYVSETISAYNEDTDAWWDQFDDDQIVSQRQRQEAVQRELAEMTGEGPQGKTLEDVEEALDGVPGIGPARQEAFLRVLGKRKQALVNPHLFWQELNDLLDISYDWKQRVLYMVFPEADPHNQIGQQQQDDPRGMPPVAPAAGGGGMAGTPPMSQGGGVQQPQQMPPMAQQTPHGNGQPSPVGQYDPHVQMLQEELQRTREQLQELQDEREREELEQRFERRLDELAATIKDEDDDRSLADELKEVIELQNTLENLVGDDESNQMVEALRQELGALAQRIEQQGTDLGAQVGHMDPMSQVVMQLAGSGDLGARDAAELIQSLNESRSDPEVAKAEAEATKVQGELDLAERKYEAITEAASEAVNAIAALAREGRSAGGRASPGRAAQDRHVQEQAGQPAAATAHGPVEEDYEPAARAAAHGIGARPNVDVRAVDEEADRVEADADVPEREVDVFSDEDINAAVREVAQHNPSLVDKWMETHDEAIVDTVAAEVHDELGGTGDHELIYAMTETHLENIEAANYDELLPPEPEPDELHELTGVGEKVLERLHELGIETVEQLQVAVAEDDPDVIPVLPAMWRDEIFTELGFEVEAEHE